MSKNLLLLTAFIFLELWIEHPEMHWRLTKLLEIIEAAGDSFGNSLTCFTRS